MTDDRKPISLEEALTTLEGLSYRHWREVTDSTDLADAAVAVAKELRSLRAELDELKESVRNPVASAGYTDDY